MAKIANFLFIHVVIVISIWLNSGALISASNSSSSWLSGQTSRTGQTGDFLRRQGGALLDFTNAENEPFVAPELNALNRVELPDSFDARIRWPNCKSMMRIFDQGRCGCCWATAGSSVIADRLCIASDGQNRDVEISVQHPLVCSGGTANLCNDAYPKTVYEMYVDKGLVTGGGYKSKIGCMPYEAFTQIESDSTNSTQCPNACTNPNYPKSYQKDKFYGQSWYAMGRRFTKDSDSVVKQIQYELMTRGPLTATFKVYDDLYGYIAGVYRHDKSGSLVGGHAVKLLGWGTEDGTDYWLFANSWGINWGMDGFFKFIRGENHLGIEKYLVTAIPL